MPSAATPQIGSIATPITPNGTPAPENARAQPLITTGPALQQLGDQAQALGDTFQKQEIDKQQAQQNIWLSQAKSAAELQSQQITADAQRSAQPGQPILPAVQDAWNQHTQQQLDTVDNPILKAKYAQVLGTVGGGAAMSSQAFDYQQQDAYTVHNINQTLNNKSAVYAGMTDRDAITNKAQADLGELTTNINSLPLDPAKRMDLLDSARKGIVLSALDAKTAIDPLATLNENAPARSPQAILNDPNMPRGIRNNNPGNLEGDQGFQGFKAQDDKGYAQFNTPQDGLRAMAINLRNQQDLHGINTVEGIVTKYAPPSENNTAAYISTVAQQMGVGPQDKLDLHDPMTLAKLQTAMIKQENGANPYSSKNIMYAAQQAVDPSHPDPDPGMSRPDGGMRTGDPLFSLLTPAEQQTQINHTEAVYRQQQYFQRQGGAQTGALLSQLEQSHQIGVPVSDDQIKELQNTAMDAKSPSLQNRVSQFVVKNDAIKEFTPMAPLEMQQTLQAAQPLIDSGQATPAQIERYRTGQQMLATTVTQLKTDPLTVYAKSSGTPVPPLETADAGAFQQRATYASSAQQLYGTQFKAFTAVEAPRIAESFNQADPAGKRAFLTNFAAGFGPKTADAAEQVWGKDAPQIAYAANMLALPNVTSDQAKTAMDIVAGTQRMKEDKDAGISTQAVDKYLADKGYNDAISPAAYDRVLAAAKATYAGRFPASYTAKAEDLDKVVSDVVGGQLTSVHGHSVISPAGSDGDSFESFVKNISTDQIQAGLEKAQTTLNNGVPMSKKPPVPMNSGGAFNPKSDALRLVTIGNGMYQMIDRNGVPYPMPSMPGGTAKLQFDAADVAGAKPVGTGYVPPALEDTFSGAR